MNKPVLFIIVASILSLFSSCEEEELLAIDNVSLYQYFSEKGYTNGEAYAMFEELNTNETAKTALNDTQVKTLKEIIVNAKQKELFPGKTGTNVLFLIVTDAEGNENQVLLSGNLLRDYTNAKDYWVDDNDLEKVSVLITELKNP